MILKSFEHLSFIRTLKTVRIKLSMFKYLDRR